MRSSPRVFSFEQQQRASGINFLLKAAHMEMKIGMHVYYMIYMTTTGIFLFYKFVIAGLPPFAEIYVIV